MAAGAEISLELDKTEYFLGENVILHWRVWNPTSTPVTFDIGGDGRTPDANRAIRFKVEAFDASGKAMLDPYPDPENMGGMGGGQKLELGESYFDNLQLMRYREFTAAGEYTLKVYHDLGWEKFAPEDQFDRQTKSDIPPLPRRAPVVTTKIRLLMPDADQARQVVAAMMELPTEPNRTWGEKGEPFADFALLRYPVYLPIAKEFVEGGDLRGLEMLGAMTFPEATAVLIEFMDHEDATIASRATDCLLARTPHPHIHSPSRRHYLFERSWNDALKTSAMEAAWRLLKDGDREQIIRGARLVQSLGGKDDLPQLIEATDRVLVAFIDHQIEQKQYLRPPTASDTLASAARELLRRGAKPPQSATTPGNAVVWLLSLNVDEGFRPEGWHDTARGLIMHDIPFIRALALENMPLPLDEGSVAAVNDAILDDFAPVQGAACDLARKSGLKAFAPSLIELLKRTDNEWIMRSAFSAAKECGVQNDERLELCLRRMKPQDNDWNMVLMQLLVDGTIESNGHGSRAIENWRPLLPGIQQAWRDFIDAHRQQLRDGKRFDVGDPALSPKMFPPEYRLHRNGKAPWPAG